VESALVSIVRVLTWKMTTLPFTLLAILIAQMKYKPNNKSWKKDVKKLSKMKKKRLCQNALVW